MAEESIQTEPEVIEGNVRLSFIKNDSIPYIIVNCEWLLNESWKNKNLSFEYGNKSSEIDMVEYCNSIKPEEAE